MATYFAIDTNAFLHFKLFTEIDWSEILKSDSLTLLLTKTVIRELDDKKNHPDKNLSSKAKKVLDKVNSCLDDEQFITHKKTFPVEVVRKVVSADFYQPRDLAESSADDRFLAEVLLFEQDHPDDRVIVVSSDTGMKVKTKWLNLEYFRLPEELKQDNKDPRDRELESLRKEVLKYQSRAPRLKVRFLDGQQRLELPVRRVEIYTEEDIEDLVTKARDRFERDMASAPEVRTTNLSTFAQLIEPDLEKYKEDWERYLAELPAYLRAKNQYDVAIARAVKIELELVNDGTAPAHVPGVHLHAPDHVRLVEVNDYKVPEEPERLTRPHLLTRIGTSTAVQKLMEFSAFAARLHSPMMEPVPISPAVYARVNGHYPPAWSAKDQDASIELRDLKNRYNKTLPALYAVLEEGCEWESFHLDVVIEAGLPDPFEHKLHVVVTPDAGEP